MGKYDLEVTTFQMAVLFAWNQRPKDRVTYDSLRLASELPDLELRRTLWVSGVVGSGQTFCSMHTVNDNWSLFTTVSPHFSCSMYETKS